MKEFSLNIKILQPFVLALVFTISATVLRIWPLDVLGDRFIWSSFYPAVVLSAIYGGLFPGLFATLLSCIIASKGWHFFSGHSFTQDNAGWLGMLVFVINGILISVVAEALKRSREKNVRANKILEEKIAQLNALSDNLPDSFVYQSTIGKNLMPEIIYVSNSVQKFVETTGGEVVRNPELLYKLIWKEDRDIFMSEQNKAARSISELKIDVRFNRQDATYGYATIHSRPRKREENGTYVWDGLFTDITERVLLEKELNRQQLRSQQLFTEMAIQEHEDEKNQVSYELHEQINQLLAAAKINMELMKSKRDPNEGMLKGSITNLKQAIEKINLLFESIDAPSFELLGLAGRIESLAKGLRQNHYPPVLLDFSHSALDELPEKIKLLLYRITKNRVHYIRDNIEPCEVMIRAKINNELLQFCISYSDDMFDADPDKWSIDLRKIKNRVEFYGGSIDVTCDKKSECKVDISLPLHVAEII